MFLFVYGTLKRGGRLHSHNMKGATFVGQDRIAGVDLFRIQWYPAAKLGSGTLHGEVYEINDEILARMDQVEGNTVQTKTTDNSRRVPIVGLPVFGFSRPVTED